MLPFRAHSGCQLRFCVCFGCYACVPKKLTLRTWNITCICQRGQIIDSHYSSTVHYLDLPGRADRYIPDLYDLYDLYDLADVAGWELYSLRDLGHVDWVGPVLYRFCTSRSGRLGSTVDELLIDHDLSDLSVRQRVKCSSSIIPVVILEQPGAVFGAFFFTGFVFLCCPYSHPLISFFCVCVLRCLVFFLLISFFQQLDQLSSASKKAQEEFQAREKAALTKAESAECTLTPYRPTINNNKTYSS